MNEKITQNNFLYIPNFISSDRAKHLSEEFKTFAKNKNLNGDSQAENSHSSYNYIRFLELLCEKTPEVSSFLEETVLPTYTYARVYKEGSTLERHKDRPACEVSLTVHLDGDSEWPIYIQKPNGEEVSLNLKSGDAMLYMGCEADHWRNKFEGQEYVQVFLHYVKSKGENSWAYFDKAREKPVDFVAKTLTKEIANNAPSVITKPKYHKNLEDYIVEFENIVPPELCDAILNEYGNSNNWGPTYVGSGQVDKTIRNVDTIYISTPQVISQNPLIRQHLDKELYKCANKAINMYNEKFPEAMIEEDSGYELLRYGEGNFYKQHTDSFKARPRAVSCSFALNDDYLGGEFSFFDQEFFYKLKKGSVLMFPSNFMFPHAVMPVTKGTRYSIITWFV